MKRKKSHGIRTYVRRRETTRERRAQRTEGGGEERKTRWRERWRRERLTGEREVSSCEKRKKINYSEFHPFLKFYIFNFLKKSEWHFFCVIKKMGQKSFLIN